MPAHGAIAADGDASFPLGLIEEAVSAAGARERRRRLLPAVAVVVFVLGCCLFSGEGYPEVARKLAGWLGPLAGGGGWRVPGTAALARARRRAGPGPLRLLFARLAGPLAAGDTPGAWAFGRLVAALDGTMLDVPHTAANIAAFGPPHGGGGDGGYPQVRLVTLAACGTRGVMDAVFRGRGAARSSEQDLARKIAARGGLRPGMLALADRNFCGYPVAAALAATGADVLIRAKSSQWLPDLGRYGDGSYRSVLATPSSGRAHAAARHRGRALPGPPAGLAVRVIESDVTIAPGGGQPRTERYRLITTLLDHRAAPAAAIAACYAQRWEIENSYKDMKAVIRGAGRVLRSQHPAGIAQEIWGLLCACQLTHTARAEAAAAIGLDPGQISATVTVRALRRAITSPATSPGVRAEALTQLLPPRRRRGYPRLMRTSTAKRRHARASLTGNITYKITIVAPAGAGPPRR
ncbi:MAG TPA: IS4 family transposase [Streptosporangiaceae bacterium]|nr:IS4 family transposase [Streptosporangiaceae bacterium]